MRSLLIGGSGAIGTALSAHLRELGWPVLILSRSAPPLTEAPFVSGEATKDLRGRYPEDLDAAIAAADVIVNLAGQSVLTTPWTKAGKLAILNSRVEPALAAVTALLSAPANATPKTYIQAAGISIYGSSAMLKDESADLSSPHPSEGFLGHVCRSWEAPALALTERAKELGLPLRTAILRIGMVLGLSDSLGSFGSLGSGTSAGVSADQQLSRMARLGLVYSLKSNQQWQSAITITDLCRLIAWLARTKSAKGIYNAVAPEPMRMAELYPALRKRYGWQLPISPPPALIKLGLGAKAELALSEFRLTPAKALAEGFTFTTARPSHTFLEHD